jgi:divinyl protochlorophyllide a 8-vinyl-reductase
MDGGPVARIGPNAILQLVPVLDTAIGPTRRGALCAAAGIDELPSGNAMIDEAPVARLHQVLRRELPNDATHLSRQAGLATGDYIMAHRIPGAAQRLLRVLPAPLSGRLLARAIATHAWTFAGSGQFRVASTRPLVFEIADNPVVRGERSMEPVCHWHAAVFERLYRKLVANDYVVEETGCCAAGADVCRFELRL